LEATARRKVPGGKLLSVRLEHDGLSILDAEVSGDFFLYPEESIDLLESSLAGIKVSLGTEELTAIIEEIMAKHGISAVGFGPRDLAAVMREALG
jgi:lipoate-protein ligase A